MITQGLKSFYIMDAEDVPLVLARLHAAGYRDTPYWYFIKGGYGLEIRPKQTNKRLTFTITAHDVTWQQYGDILEQPTIDRVVTDLQAVGWQQRQTYCLTADKTVVYIAESRYQDRITYHLEIKGFRPQAVRDILE